MEEGRAPLRTSRRTDGRKRVRANARPGSRTQEDIARIEEENVRLQNDLHESQINTQRLQALLEETAVQESPIALPSAGPITPEKAEGAHAFVPAEALPRTRVDLQAEIQVSMVQTAGTPSGTSCW